MIDKIKVIYIDKGRTRETIEKLKYIRPQNQASRKSSRSSNKRWAANFEIQIKEKADVGFVHTNRCRSFDDPRRKKVNIAWEMITKTCSI